ncbi:MAG: hypothetical protein COV07_03305 [Candidatus Vogelbacteria bacterium CG10_big_fil_rev_8_21_14_0_10_45_14]|uniref:DUF4145 domain-containing protein n=1 Tax=Candidatus Vogelbacteria bacterium CG10_big_fil_rev_8_21_14_0_10_45_14 TaxID=1975042 RepID=A0A2H0RJL8_9BACT|nr:MAG: hypothetical protein COV07_03305 [Candidatus Vogelbacteria bacterium CG10_big_fil_rev_8_21_14_0_10_45_14]
MFLNLEYIFYLIYSFVARPFGGGGAGGFVPSEGLDATVFALKVVMWSIAIIVGALCVYVYYLKVKLLRDMDKHLLQTMHENAELAGPKNRDFDRLLNMVDSDNPAEWKIAILEADKMLEALVYQLGFEGDSLGERLRNADTSRMTTLESAWEAHKIRNRVAHEPRHVLTKREARRALTQYEAVLHEFGIV